MEDSTLRRLKTTFLAHFIVGGVFGIILLLVRDMWGTMSVQPLLELVIYRDMGAAILGFAFASWLAYQDTQWEKVKITMLMEIVWTALFVIVNIYGILSGQLPPLDWVNIVIVGGFGIAFAIFYFQK